MTDLVRKYISYIRDVRRYSQRTVSNYTDVLKRFCELVHKDAEVSDKELLASLNVSEIRTYEVFLIDSGLSSKTVNLHMSALSGFCSFLVKEGMLNSNPVKLVTKPKVEKRLPVFYKQEAMEGFFESTSYLFSPETIDAFLEGHAAESGKKIYGSMLVRLIISMLYSLGLRRAELIGLNLGDVDFGRNLVKVRGKGDKMREIPLIASLSEEILLYLKAVETMCGGERSLKEPLLVTYRMKPIYPVYVDRTIKSELEDV